MRAEIARTLKRIVPIGLVLAACCMLIAPGAAGASAPAASGRTAKVLMLYNAPEPPPDAAVMEKLLMHFRVMTETAHSSVLDDLPADAADFIIHFDSIGASDRERKAASARALELDIPYMGFASGAADEAHSGILVKYRDAEYPTTAIPFASLDPGTNGTVIARVSDGRDDHPLIVRDGNRWQVAAGLRHGQVDWLIADVLHDFLGEHHPEERSGLLIVGNVNPLSDPEQLRGLADLLRNSRIPFAIAVEPARRPQSPGERASVDGNPELADALRYMTEAGGTIVLDGSRLDPADPEEAARTITRNIALLHEIGGYPVALYASGALVESLATAFDQVYFSNVIEYSDFRADGTRFSGIPYTRIRGADGLTIPESVGAAGSDAATSSLLSRMSRLRIVRDALFGVGLNAALPVETAALQVEQLARESVMWMDIRYTPYRVETGFIRLSGRGDGTMDAMILDQDRMTELQKSERQTAYFESITYYSTWTLALVVAGFVATFMLFIVIMQMRRRRRLFMERELE